MGGGGEGSAPPRENSTSMSMTLVWSPQMVNQAQPNPPLRAHGTVVTSRTHGGLQWENTKEKENAKIWTAIVDGCDRGRWFI